MATGPDIAATQQNTSIPLVGKAFFESNLGTSTEFAFSNAHTDNNLSGFKNLTDKTEDKRQKKEDRFSYMVSRMTDTGFALSKQDIKNIARKDLDDGLTDEERAQKEDAKEQLAENGDPEAIQEHNENADQVAAESGGTMTTVTDENGIKSVVAAKEGMEDEAEVIDAKVAANSVAEQSGDTELIEETEADLETVGEEAKREAVEQDLGIDIDTPPSPGTSVASDMMGDGGAPVTSMGDFSAAAAPVTNPGTAPTIEQPVITPVTQDVNIPALQ